MSLPTNDNDIDLDHFKEADAGDGTKRQDQYLHGLKLFLCFFSLFLCLFLFALDQTIISTILSTVGNQFQQFENIGWLSTGFLLTMAVFVQPFGKLSIIFGRKWTMVVAVFIFEAGSLLCGLANSMNILIGGRVLAGIGGAGIQGLVFVIVSEIVPIHKRPIGMAIISVTFAVASVLGPLLGGVFTTHLTWRWAFYINLPIGGVALAVFLYSFRPPTPKKNYLQQLKQFDYFGTFLLISGCVLLLLAITFGTSLFNWNEYPVIVCFILSGLCVIAFCIWNYKYSKDQIISIQVVRVPQIIASTLAIAGIFTAFIISLIYGAVYFQVIQGVNALNTGLHLLPTIISTVVSSLLTGVLIQKTRYVKIFSVAAGILSPIGLGLLTLLRVDSSMADQIGLLIILGLATGLQMQSSIISAQIKSPQSPSGMINTTIFYNFGRCMMSAIGATLSDAVYSSTIKNNFVKNAQRESFTVQLELQNFDPSALLSSNEILNTLSLEAQLFVKTQMMDAIINVFYMCIGFASISTFASVFVTKKRLPKEIIGDKAETQKLQQ